MRRPIPAIHYNIAAFGSTRSRLCPYATFGSAELAANIEAVMRTGTDGALLANHGAVAVAAGLDKASKNAALLEFLATAYYHSLVIGGGVRARFDGDSPCHRAVQNKWATSSRARRPCPCREMRGRDRG